MEDPSRSDNSRMVAGELALQPTLTGELLQLRPLHTDDFQDLFAVASDPLIWEQHPARDRWKEDVFRRAYWGGAYNGEMKRLMLQHAFRSVKRVLFVIGPLNCRSRRAVEKLGAVHVGSRTEADGRESVVYAVTGPHPTADAFLLRGTIR